MNDPPFYQSAHAMSEQPTELPPSVLAALACSRFLRRQLDSRAWLAERLAASVAGRLDATALRDYLRDEKVDDDNLKPVLRKLRAWVVCHVLVRDMFQSTRPRGARLRKHKCLSPLREIPAEREAGQAGGPHTVPGSPENRFLSVFQSLASNANVPGFSRPLGVRAKVQKTSGPFRSNTDLAPTCSTRLCQFLPK